MPGQMCHDGPSRGSPPARQERMGSGGRDWTVETSGGRGAGPRVPPWKMAWSDIPIDPAMRALDLAHWGMHLFLLARSDADGVFWATPGRTVFETVVVSVVGCDLARAELLLREMAEVALIEIDPGAAWLRFRPEAWRRRQTLARLRPEVEAADPQVEQGAPLKARRARPTSTDSSFDAVQSQIERTDRSRFRQAARVLAAGGTPEVRIARYAHAPGVTFEQWLATDGAWLLADRRKHDPTYAFGVSGGAPGASGHATGHAEPASGHVRGHDSDVSPNVSGNVSPLHTQNGTSEKSDGYQEELKPDTHRDTRDAVSRVPCPVTGHGGDEVPEKGADAFRVPPGAHAVLRAWIDRANARTGGNLQDRILAGSAGAQALRLAAWRLHEAGITVEDLTQDADLSRRGRQIFEELVALVRSEPAMKRVVGRWKEVVAVGFRLPLQSAAHRDGLIVTQLCAEAQAKVAARLPVLPFAGDPVKGRAPVSAHAQPPADGRDRATHWRYVDGQLVQVGEIVADEVPARAVGA